MVSQGHTLLPIRKVILGPACSFGINANVLLGSGVSLSLELFLQTLKRSESPKKKKTQMGLELGYKYSTDSLYGSTHYVEASFFLFSKIDSNPESLFTRFVRSKSFYLLLKTFSPFVLCFVSCGADLQNQLKLSYRDLNCE